MGISRGRCLHRIGLLGILGITLWGCGGESPTASPINNSISQVRTMTPRTRPFSELDDEEQPISESLLATFLLSPAQLAQIAEASTSVAAQTLGSCMECFSDPDPQPSQDREVKRLGTYELDDLSLQLQFRVPESTTVGQVAGSIRFQIDTNTQFLNPGYGAQLQILNAVLQDAATSPEQQVEASALSDPVDFPEKEITKGQSSTRSITMTFGEVPFQTRYLRLEVMLTSPIPRDDQEGKVAPPPEGKLYQGLWLGSDLNPDRIQAHEEQIGKSSAWIGFTHHWPADFPLEQATSIRSQGSVPYLRWILPETGEEAEAIRAGERDEALRAWGEAIRSFKSPLIFGVGPTDRSQSEEQTTSTYRYVLEQIQPQQLPNLSWVYHPDLETADLSQAYPGDRLVDWIALELRVDPNSEETFQSQMDQLYPQVAALSARQPIVVTAMGLTSGPADPEEIPWLEGSITELINQRWPRLIGFAWDGSSISLESSSDISEIFQRTVGSSEAVLGRVTLETPQPTPPPSAPGSPTPDTLGSPTPASNPAPQPSPPSPDPERIEDEQELVPLPPQGQQPTPRPQPAITQP